MTGRFLKNKRKAAGAHAKKQRRADRHGLERLMRHADQVNQSLPMSDRNMRARIDRELAQQRRAASGKVLLEGGTPGAGGEGTAGAVFTEGEQP